MENNVNNFKAFKEAKHILPHIIAILKVFDLSIKSLKHFNCYLPVMRVLTVMEEQKELLEFHKNKYENIIKNKGKL